MGTNFLAEIIPKHGNRVVGVEPNARCARRAIARSKAMRNSRALPPPLPGRSIDLITPGQPLHLFALEKAGLSLRAF